MDTASSGTTFPLRATSPVSEVDCESVAEPASSCALSRLSLYEKVSWMEPITNSFTFFVFDIPLFV